MEGHDSPATAGIGHIQSSNSDNQNLTRDHDTSVIGADLGSSQPQKVMIYPPAWAGEGPRGGGGEGVGVGLITETPVAMRPYRLQVDLFRLAAFLCALMVLMAK